MYEMRLKFIGKEMKIFLLIIFIKLLNEQTFREVSHEKVKML